MNLPEAIKQLLAQFAAIFPVPTGEPGEAHEENVRQWTTRFCQQVAFAFPNQGYGSKRAGDGRPLSKDTLAKIDAGLGLVCWDLLIGTGTGRPILSLDPQFHAINGQQFVAVEPVNYLALPPGDEEDDVNDAKPDAPPAPKPLPACQCKAIDAAAEVLDLLQEVRLEQAKSHDAILRALARLENDNRKPRPVTVSGRWVGTLKGDVGGIDGL
jgi:hypothetical protein